MLAASPQNVDAQRDRNAHSITVGRTYLLGLRSGESQTTACSMSLVMHLCQICAARDRSGFRRWSEYHPSPRDQIAILPGDCFVPGRAVPHRAAADGFCAVRAPEGGRRLTDAVRDGDQVLAVVRGSAVNQDGRSTA